MTNHLCIIFSKSSYKKFKFKVFGKNNGLKFVVMIPLLVLHESLISHSAAIFLLDFFELK